MARRPALLAAALPRLAAFHVRRGSAPYLGLRVRSSEAVDALAAFHLWVAGFSREPGPAVPFGAALRSGTSRPRRLTVIDRSLPATPRVCGPLRSLALRSR
jgi:hypothetical protein